MNESNCQYDVTWDMKSDKDEDTRATEGGTLRADGTRRKERKIRPGYNPPGSVQVYVPRHRRARGEVRVIVIYEYCVLGNAWWF
jgi:hypothetical protein